MYALRSLLTSLAPLIGAEVELGEKAVAPGWAEGASKEKIDDWRKKGIDLVKEEMEILIQQTCAAEYGRLMHKVCYFSLMLTLSWLIKFTHSVLVCGESTRPTRATSHVRFSTSCPTIDLISMRHSGA